MHSSSILMATFAAAVSANMQRMVVTIPKLVAERGVWARQTDSASGTASVDPVCESASETLASLVEDLPTPPAALESWAEASATATAAASSGDDDDCNISVPASLSSEYSAYSTSVLEWYSSWSSEIEAVVAECTEFEADATALSVCTSNDALATGSSTGTASVASVSATTTSTSKKTTTTTSTGTSSASGSSTQTSSSSATSAAATAGAAAREVGIAGAVIAGVLGAVIAL
ncbi:hypothetical protein BD289DRAFT_455019 [Coniella lustricola]|uniref:Infection structure specific protein n=1 Tax=Coniella lustricola TaxID=2025994 RepID=A0A2T3A191_9PEZI|nr:hypothetical protein BD289DRAFT_455019 [Coniella lustricola]